MKKVVRLTESDLVKLVNKVIKETTITEQSTTFASVFPSVNMLTNTNIKTAPIMGGNNGTNIIYLTKRDANGNPIPGTKFSYKLTGKYGFIPLNIILRNVSRNAAGKLTGEVQPSNSIVKKAMMALIPKQHITPDGWLRIEAPRDKINDALTQLHQTKGSSAEMELEGGVDITLEQV